MTAEQAIARSISHDEIVTVDDVTLLPDLSAEADDFVSHMVDDVRVTEFWGAQDGRTWRVHVRHVGDDAACEGDYHHDRARDDEALDREGL